MTQARGYRSRLGFDFETVFKTTPAVPAGINMPFISCGLSGNQTLSDDNLIRGRRDPAMPSRGNIDINGTISTQIDTRAIGYWMKACFGAPVTTGSSASYTHVFKAGNTQPSLVLEKGFPDIGVYELFNGCKVSNFSTEYGGEGDQTINFDIAGARQTVGATSFDTTLTEIANYTKFNRFQATLLEAGASICSVTTMSLTVDFGLSTDQYTICSGGEREDIPEGLMQVTGSITGLFENSTLLNKAINGTESSLQITLTNGANIFDINIPELLLERASPPIDGPQGVVQTLNFRGYYANSTQNAVIVATLTNDIATYA